MPHPHPRRRRPLRARLRRSPVLWWAAALGLAGLTGLAVNSSLARAEAVLHRYGDLRMVAVLTRSVAPGQTVAGDAVRYERRPADFLPNDPMAGTPDGRVALDHLVAGEVLVESRLAPNNLRGTAALLPSNSRALSVPGGPGGRPPVEIGDRVDVLVTLAEAAEPTTVVASSALVVAVDDQADSVTVAVRPDEAPRVAFALAVGAVTLALTSADSGQPRARATPMMTTPSTTR